MNIIVKEELKAYIDPLTPEEHEALERSILAEGCRDALVLWGDVLVDGHNRHGICTKHGIPFQTVQNPRFKSMEDVHLWMIDQHLGRRSLSDYQRAINKSTKLLLRVHRSNFQIVGFTEQPPLEELVKLAHKHKLPVIEDAAQSFGAIYKGTKSGNLSTIACTSFFPSKPLGCYGDGGAIFTNDEQLATVIRQTARHGQDRRYHHIRVGVNSRLDTLQAAILLPKLAILEEEMQLRQQVAQMYAIALQAAGLAAPFIELHNRSAYAQFTIRIQNRSAVQTALKEASGRLKAG